MRWTEEQFAEVKARMEVDADRRLQHGVELPSGMTRKPAKYRNRKVTHNGEKFDSVREMQAWKVFRTQELMGAIRSVIRQVSMPMPSSHRRIRIDFLVIENDGKHRWFDAKGFATPEFKLKSDIVKSGYGITIELI